jgi:hypothetical protein
MNAVESVASHIVDVQRLGRTLLERGSASHNRYVREPPLAQQSA